MTTPTQVAPSTTTPTPPAAPVVEPTSADATRAGLRGTTYEEGAAAVAPPSGYTVGTKGTAIDSANPAAGTRYGYTTDPSGRVVADPSKSERGYMRSLDPGGGIPWNQGGGNRAGDVADKKGEVANKTVDLKTVTGIPEPELDKIKSTHKGEVKGAAGTYAGYDVAAGDASGGSTDFDGKFKSAAGKDSAELTGPNAYYQAGATAKGYAGIKGEAEGALGKASGKAEAYGKAYAGLSGKAGISGSLKGTGGDFKASAEGAIGAGVEVGVTGKGDLKTPGLKVDGVTTPLDVGIGVGGSAKAYAKAGAGGGAYLSKDKIGLEGKIGAAAAAEAKADIHGNIGPLAAKGEVGVLAGAGIGAEGGIIYEDGKLTIGGRAYAALGYGVSGGVSVTIDLKQSYQVAAAVLKKAADLGIEGAKAAYKAADADNDGKLSLNDGATHASNAMNAGAAGVERSVDGAIDFLDGDGDGKFDFKKDMGARATQAKDAVVGAGKRALDAGKEVVDGAKKAVGKAVDRAHDAADIDNDGKLSMKDVSAGVDKAKDWAGQKFDEGAKWAAQKKDEAVAWGEAKLDEAKKAAEAVGTFADRNQDGKLGLDDVKQGAGEIYDAGKKAVSEGVDRAGKAVGDAKDWAKEKAGAAADWAKDKGGAAVDWAKEKGAAAVEGAKDLAKQAHAAADRDGDGKLSIEDVKTGATQAKQAVVAKATEVKQKLEQGYESAKKTVVDGAKAAYDAADLNKDGKVDAADATIAAQRAREAAARAAAQAKERAAQAYKAAQDAAKKLEEKAKATVDAAHKAADRDGDGKLSMGDVKAGASQAYDAASTKAAEVKQAVVSGAQAAYKSASDGISRASETLSNGYNQATERAGAAWGRFTTFMSGG